MAFINLLHNGYQGKLGETVGQKWKNQRTVRTYNPHNNSKSEAQLEQRAKYKELLSVTSIYYSSSQNFIPYTTKGLNKFNCYTRLINKMQGFQFQEGQFFELFNYKDKNVFNQRLFTMDGKLYIFVNQNDDGSIPKERDLSLSVFINLVNDYRGISPNTPIEIKGFLNKSYSPQAQPDIIKRGCLLEVTNFYQGGALTLLAIRKREGKSYKLSQLLIVGSPQRVDSADFIDN